MNTEVKTLESQYFELFEDVHQSISKVAERMILKIWRDVRSKWSQGGWEMVPTSAGDAHL